MNAFQRSFLQRLGLGCVLASVLAGLAGTVIETVKGERLADALARKEALALVSGHPGEDVGSAVFPDQWQEFVRRVLKENCLLVRVYGPRGDLLQASVAPGLPLPVAELEGRLRSIHTRPGFHLHRFILAGRPMVQIQQPLVMADGQGPGRLEAVFQLDPKAFAFLKGYVQRLTLTALLAVLATGGLMYPLLSVLNRRILRFNEDLVTANLELASVLGAAVAQRDSGTGGHNFRVTLYALRLGLALEDPTLDLRALLLGAFLHDAGKIGIQDVILLKPGPLTPEERAIMQTHVERGVAIIGSSKWLALARKVIECHHERYDGTGYPRRLWGLAIPLEARIFAIVDVFDALMSARPYKPAMPLQDVLAILEREAGTHFDPDLVARFHRIAPEAYAEFGHARDEELQTRLSTWVDRNRAHLQGDRPVAADSIRWDGAMPQAVPE